MAADDQFPDFDLRPEEMECQINLLKLRQGSRVFADIKGIITQMQIGLVIVGGQCECGPEFCLAVERLHDFAKVVIQIAPQESAFRLAELRVGVDLVQQVLNISGIRSLKSLLLINEILIQIPEFVIQRRKFPAAA